MGRRCGALLLVAACVSAGDEAELVQQPSSFVLCSSLVALPDGLQRRLEESRPSRSQEPATRFQMLVARAQPLVIYASPLAKISTYQNSTDEAQCDRGLPALRYRTRRPLGAEA